MYLSRLSLDPLRRTTQRCLSNLYHLHEALLLGFDPDRVQSGGRMLYRLEPERSEQLVQLLVQSETPPSWNSLYFSEALPTCKIDGPKQLDLNFTAGQHLRFRLRANPTRTVGGDKTRSGKRYAIVDEQGQSAWLESKLTKGGYVLLAHQVRDERSTRVRRLRTDGTDGVEFVANYRSVLFDGVIRVSDLDAAISTIRNGIGTAKAFGFGLLSVACL